MTQTLTQTFTIQREVQLRFLLPTDIPEIKSLCSEWFPIEYPTTWYEDITSNPNYHSLAATYGSKIIGILVCEIQPFSKCNREDTDMLATKYLKTTQVAYILSLGVVKDFRRHGIASLLLDNLISYLTSGAHDSCKAVYLHVLTTNTTAIRFYERRKFVLHNYLPYYYSIHGTPQDGFSYVLYINGGQPPWTIIYPFLIKSISKHPGSIITSIDLLTDYTKYLGGVLSRFQPCLLPKRLFQSTYKLWRRIMYGAANTAHQVCYS
ncbi:hypothetical protein CAPTEDRAFT_176991 [Capitella teleta]|uniref:N-alpha-acetyltransferase 60 n=1 Tax=Capitella teleta TaxID=283909 RepID=R7THM0_CAPTE|nr:hypothetical protein CAPTEDRAFT_176991 [Capitella teleta]|eukprot:ELT92957.1 hypothetical protein CAPTEDRAFT_176991 [Capitella teleta]